MEEKINTKSEKQLAKFNALKHGILSKHIVLPWENREVYEELLHSLIKKYDPQHTTEENFDRRASVGWHPE